MGSSQAQHDHDLADFFNQQQPKGKAELLIEETVEAPRVIACSSDATGPWVVVHMPGGFSFRVRPETAQELGNLLVKQAERAQSWIPR